ncbi:MAG TPA: replication protein [Blastocatellia bacterium]|jgi:DNA-binding Lrp family transcriptional regulator
MNSKRKAALEESLSSALEPPRKRQVARLDSILADYIDPRDVPPATKEHGSNELAVTQVPDTRIVQHAIEASHTRLVQDTIVEAPDTKAQDTTLGLPTSLVYDSTVALRTTLAVNQGEPEHGATVGPPTTQEHQTMVGQYTVVETEYTKTPNDLWDDIMPTLDPYDQAVLWQLYRLTRGYHRSTCTIGFPRLATRCNISPKQAQISIGRLEKRGLIRRNGSDFGNRNIAERGNIYEVFLPEGREAYRTRVARSTRVEQATTVAPNAFMKVNTQNESTQTQAGVSVQSRFSLEECRRYADHLKATGQGIINPGGYATKIFRSGEADVLIEGFLNPRAELDISQCGECLGMGFIYIDPSDKDRGVKPCKHDGLRSRA